MKLSPHDGNRRDDLLSQLNLLAYCPTVFTLSDGEISAARSFQHFGTASLGIINLLFRADTALANLLFRAIYFLLNLLFRDL